MDSLNKRVTAVIELMKDAGISEAEYADIDDWSREDQELFLLAYEDMFQKATC